MTLDAPVAIPVGLAVARKEESGLHVGYGSRMPILEVTALPQAESVDIEAVEQALVRAASAELGGAAAVWVVWRSLEPGHYSEGDAAPATQPATTHPPIVRIVAYEGRSPELIARVTVAVAETLVRELGLAPGNAFVSWEELRAGRVYTGGGVLGA